MTHANKQESVCNLSTSMHWFISDNTSPQLQRWTASFRLFLPVFGF